MVGGEAVAGTLAGEEAVVGPEVSVTGGNGGSETVESAGAGARAGGMLLGAMSTSSESGETRNI